MPKFRTGRRRNGSTYHYPITPRTGRRRRRRVKYRISRNIQKPWRPPQIRAIKVGEPIIKACLNSVLRQIPVFRELHSAYIVADSIYTNWSLIKGLYDEYAKHGWEGLAVTVGEEVAHSALSSVQTNIIWGVLRQYIPKSFHDRSLNILSNVVEKITDEEIRYVKRFLQETR